MNVEEYFDLGFKKQCAEQFAEAIELFTKAIELDKDYERAYVFRAGCRGRLKDYKGALEDYKIGIALGSNDPMTYFNIASVTYMLNNKTKNISYIQKALELGIEDAQAYYFRGYIYQNRKAYRLSINDFKLAIEYDYLPSISYFECGRNYMHLDNLDKAIECFNKSIELDSQNANNYSWRGLCYKLMEEYDKAISDYKKAQELGDKSAEEEIKECLEELEKQKSLLATK